MLNPPDIKKFPMWIEIPNKYLDMLSQTQEECLPWYLLDSDDQNFRLTGLRSRYPNRVLFPFARHDYSDDVACWEKDKPGKVVIIHDFASAGWEDRFEFSSFDEWYNYVVNC